MFRIGAVVAASILALSATTQASAEPDIASPSSANDLALAMGVPAQNLVSASLGSSDPLGFGVANGSMAGFPREGGTFSILASGFAASADDPDDNNDEVLSAGGPGDDKTGILGGLDTSQATDLVQLSLRLNVPSGFGCMAFDFAFFSEEFPDFINSPYNDTFLAEVGGPGSASTFTIQGNEVVAPNNIAFDTNGDALDVNSAFGFDPSNPNPATGSTYDGTSGALVTRAQVTPGSQVEVVFSVMDLGDSILDAAAFIDNFRWTTDPPEKCQPGAQPADPLSCEAPYSHFATSWKNRTNPTNVLAAIDQGFISVWDSSSDGESGRAGFRSLVLGGKKGSINLLTEDVTKDPSRFLETRHVLGCDVTPSFSGDAEITAKLRFRDGNKAVVASGSAAALDLVPGEVIKVGLQRHYTAATGQAIDQALKKYISFLEVISGLLNLGVNFQVAKIEDKVFLEVGTGPDARRAESTVAEIGSIYWSGPLSQSVDLSGREVQVTLQASVTQGSPITILSGVESNTRTWGWAFGVHDFSGGIELVEVTIKPVE